MKNIVRKIFGMAAALCMLVGSAWSIDLGRPILSEDESFNTKISSTLNREEHRRIMKYEYSGKLGSNSYKYINVKKVISYVNRVTKDVLAEFTIMMKFKYNEKTKEAECLSTSYGSMAKDTDYTVTVFNRKANNTTGQGAGISNVEFRYRGETQDKFSKLITCDYLGNISDSDC